MATEGTDVVNTKVERLEKAVDAVRDLVSEAYCLNCATGITTDGDGCGECFIHEALDELDGAIEGVR